MNVAKINLSQTYVQDEHQRSFDSVSRAVDTIAKSTAYTEVRLGHVYVNSTTKGLAQQCVETEILVSGSGINARYFSSTMPFAGSVLALCIDIPVTITIPITVSLVKTNGIAGATVNVLNVGANASNAYNNLAMAPVAFKPGDIFYAVVTFPTAVSSTNFCGYVKMYIQTGS